MRMGVRHATAVTAATLLILGGLAACDDGDPGADPSTSPSASSPTATDSSGEPTTETSPTVAPATGPVVNMTNIRLHGPQGWELGDPILSSIQPVHDGRVLHLSNMQVSDSPSLAGDSSLARLARIAVKTYTIRRGKILDNVTVNGVEMYHLAGYRNTGHRFNAYGCIYNGYDIDIFFTFDPDDYKPAEQQQIMDEVLASVEWLSGPG